MKYSEDYFVKYTWFLEDTMKLVMGTAENNLEPKFFIA